MKELCRSTYSVVMISKVKIIQFIRQKLRMVSYKRVGRLLNKLPKKYVLVCQNMNGYKISYNILRN
jgi:predicted transcriptional regulator